MLLRVQTESLPDKASFPLLIDTKTAAAFVGVGEGVIRRWVSQGLPFIRAGRGGKKLYTRKDIERWIERLKECV